MLIINYDFRILKYTVVKKIRDYRWHRILLVSQPENYYDLIEKNTGNQFCKKFELPCLIHLFVIHKNEFEMQMKLLLKRINPTTVIWVSWYQKAVGLKQRLQKMQ